MLKLMGNFFFLQFYAQKLCLTGPMFSDMEHEFLLPYNMGKIHNEDISFILNKICLQLNNRPLNRSYFLQTNISEAQMSCL